MIFLNSDWLTCPGRKPCQGHTIHKKVMHDQCRYLGVATDFLVGGRAQARLIKVTSCDFCTCKCPLPPSALSKTLSRCSLPFSVALFQWGEDVWGGKFVGPVMALGNGRGQLRKQAASRVGLQRALGGKGVLE